MTEVGPQTDFEVDEKETLVDIDTLSDHDLMMLGLMESTSESDQEQAKILHEKKERREETFRQIAEFYGDEPITYHTYTGSAVYVAEVCPAAMIVVEQGFEAFRDWVEAHRTNEAEDASDETEDEIDSGAKDDKSGDSEEAEPKVEPMKVVAEERVVDTPRKEVVVKERIGAKPRVDTLGAAQAVVAAAVLVESIQKDNLPTEDGPTTHLEELKVKPISNGTVEQVESTVKSEPIVKVSENVVVSEKDTEPLTEIIESEGELNNEAKAESESVFTEPVEELDEGGELKSEQPVDEIFEYFESWNSAAKVEPPMEDFFIQVIDTLDGRFPEVAENNEVDTVGDEKSIPETELEFSAPVPEEFVEVFAHLEIIESPEHIEELEVFDQELRQDARIEMVALLVSVKTARKAVDRLFEAKTKEECQVHLAELKVELMLILQSLGYENAEMIVRDFLKSHSPQALKDLINELEKSLRRIAYRTAHIKQVHRQKTRHARLGKFIQFIMQAVNPTRTVDLLTT